MTGREKLPCSAAKVVDLVLLLGRFWLGKDTVLYKTIFRNSEAKFQPLISSPKIEKLKVQTTLNPLEMAVSFTGTLLVFVLVGVNGTNFPLSYSRTVLPLQGHLLNRQWTFSPPSKGN